MLTLLLVCFIAIVSAFKFEFPPEGSQIPFNSLLAVTYNTEGSKLYNFTVKYNDAIVEGPYESVFGIHSFNAKTNGPPRSNMKILAEWTDLRGNPAFAMMTVLPLSFSSRARTSSSTTRNNDLQYLEFFYFWNSSPLSCGYSKSKEILISVRLTGALLSKLTRLL